MNESDQAIIDAAQKEYSDDLNEIILEAKAAFDQTIALAFISGQASGVAKAEKILSE